MKDLKTLLFEETLWVSKKRKYTLDTYGEWSKEYDIQHAKFCVLYGLIEDSGLEEEYQVWKEGQAKK